MVLNRIKNINPLGKGKYPRGFNQIINSFTELNLSENNISQIWKAYQLGSELHEGQLRRSGEPYFNHCIDVSKILINWNVSVR